MSAIFGKSGEVPCRSREELLEGNWRAYPPWGGGNREKGEEGQREESFYSCDPGAQTWEANWSLKNASYTAEAQAQSSSPYEAQTTTIIRA